MKKSDKVGWIMSSILAIIMGVWVFMAFAPHPFQSLCLYQYKTTTKRSSPQTTIYTYEIFKMPWACVDIIDRGSLETLRVTLDEGRDTPEFRKYLENKLNELVLFEKKRQKKE